MITASAAFMEKVNNGEIPFIRMQLVQADNTSIWLEDERFWADSVTFTEATSQEDAFTVGSAIIGSFNFFINNFDRGMDAVSFEGARVIPFIYYDIDGTREYLPKGIYYMTTHVTSGNIIRCTAMDAMKLLDKHKTAITYPSTVQTVVQTICAANGIALANQTVRNGSIVVPQPSSEQESMLVTDRQVLSYVCQISGNYAKLNENGQMVIGWYDFSSPISVNTTFDGKTLWTVPIEVTGVSVLIDGEETERLYGTDDNVINVNNNPFITTSNVSAVQQLIANEIFEHEMRPGSLPILSNPCLQAGDVLSITDRLTNVVYNFPITSLTYTKNLTELIVCAFESKEDSDLRPASGYNTRVSVTEALRQAQLADAIARRAEEMAQQSHYQLVVQSDKGIAFYADEEVTLTGLVYDQDMNEIDVDGTEFIYRWWVTQDGMSSTYLDGGKSVLINVGDAFCDFTAGVYFETIDVEQGVLPFTLCDRSGALLTNRAGEILTVRAASRYQT
jgi:hypothetical protein